MNAHVQTESLGPALAIGLALFVGALLCACGKSDKDKDETAQSAGQKPAAQVVIENGARLVVLDTATQNRLGLVVGALKAITTRAQINLPAVVLSAQDLATFRTSYVGVQAQLQKARIQSEADEKEYARLKALFDDNQNASEKSVQVADAARQTDAIEVRTEERQLSMQTIPLRQDWGDVVAKWAVEDSPQLEDVLEQREMLIQTTVPAGSDTAPPKTIEFEVQPGRRAGATFVSAFPHVDPRIQGRSFLYRTPAQLALAPGLNLIAQFSRGNLVRGALVPASAVVWSEGRPWVYVAVAADRFERRSISTDVAVDGGFVATTGFAAADKIVTTGGQALLSEELLIHGQGADTDDD